MESVCVFFEIIYLKAGSDCWIKIYLNGEKNMKIGLYQIDILDLMVRSEFSGTSLIIVDMLSSSRSIMTDNSAIKETLSYYSKVFQQAKRILVDNGNIYIQCDQSNSHYFKVLLDKIFGRENFINEILVPLKLVGSRPSRIILRYGKTKDYKNHKLFRKPNEKDLSLYNAVDSNGSYYAAPLIFKNERPNLYYEWRGYIPKKGYFWKYSKDGLEKLYSQNRVLLSDKGGLPRLKVYLDGSSRLEIGSLWSDISETRGIDQKIIERIILMSSDEKDVVFLSSEFTLPSKLPARNYIFAFQNNKYALETGADFFTKDYVQKNFPVVSEHYQEFELDVFIDREIETRLRLVSISSKQFFICIKYGLWGSNNSNLNNWYIGDNICFIVNKKIAGLAKVDGQLFKTNDKIWNNGTYPYRIPLKFNHILDNNNRVIIEDVLKEVSEDQWSNDVFKFKLLLPGNTAEKIIALINSKRNRLGYYLNNIDKLIEENIEITEIEDQSDNNENDLESEINKKDNLYFKSLYLDKWRQFEKINIDFHERLTIITGANGSGKSTLLNILTSHFGWENLIKTTPKRDNTGIYKYASDSWKNESQNDVRIGSVRFSDGQLDPIYVPNTNVGVTYELKIKMNNEIRGIHIPSHRPLYSFKQVDSIPTQIRPLKDIFQDYANSVKNEYFSRSSDRRPIQILKESLISMAMFGYGNEVITRNFIALELFKDFQSVLREVLPGRMGFQEISIQIPEVILNTRSGDFSLDTVSGGIASIIDLAWQIFLYNRLGLRFVVTIDEPENHLHPEMQRSLMPSLISAFPNIQFIIVTHSPFIISSVPDSNVYILKYNDKNNIESQLLDMINKAGSSNDILREALGLPVTIPIWVEDRLNNIIERYSDKEITEEILKSLTNEMALLKLDKYIPKTLASVIEGANRDDTAN
jgi:predicted ATPase